MSSTTAVKYCLWGGIALVGYVILACIAGMWGQADIGAQQRIMADMQPVALAPYVPPFSVQLKHKVQKHRVHITKKQLAKKR